MPAGTTSGAATSGSIRYAYATSKCGRQGELKLLKHARKCSQAWSSQGYKRTRTNFGGRKGPRNKILVYASSVTVHTS